MASIDSHIDLTALTETLSDTFRRWALNYISAQVPLIPGLQWFAFPPFSTLLRGAAGYCLNLLTRTAEMEALFLSISLQKSGEAQAFIRCTTKSQDLRDALSRGEKITSEDLLHAEIDEMDAFRSFVTLAR